MVRGLLSVADPASLVAVCSPSTAAGRDSQENTNHAISKVKDSQGQVDELTVASNFNYGQACGRSDQELGH